MNKLALQFEKAKKSKFRLWLLNKGLLNIVPFNKPHNIEVVTMDEEGLLVSAKNKRANQNHIKGVHACLLATLCEYVSGLSLLLELNPKEYRIILKSIQMTYHYQAKTRVYARFHLDNHILENEILKPLQTETKLFKEFSIQVFDEEKNHICTGFINWQIKSWKNVKTEM